MLAMLELDDDTAALLDAGAELERRLGTPDGLTALVTGARSRAFDDTALQLVAAD
ncbi:MAG: hypothetical protein ACAH82_11760 [Solirubrobacteraceae bacterium]